MIQVLKGIIIGYASAITINKSLGFQCSFLCRLAIEKLSDPESYMWSWFESWLFIICKYNGSYMLCNQVLLVALSSGMVWLSSSRRAQNQELLMLHQLLNWLLVGYSPSSFLLYIYFLSHLFLLHLPLEGWRILQSWRSLIFKFRGSFWIFFLPYVDWLQDFSPSLFYWYYNDIILSGITWFEVNWEFFRFLFQVILKTAKLEEWNRENLEDRFIWLCSIGLDDHFHA